MRKLSERAQEILENLWVQEEEKKHHLDINILRDDPALKELLEQGHLKEKEGKAHLTKKGLEEACLCVRRHRLAERLMADVFDLKKGKVHEAGCKFEHIIQEELEENICTLLGHPTECPHGSSIPPGKCCNQFKAHPKAIVKSLANLKSGERGVISYIHTKEKSALQKIMALGALPGSSIKLLRKFPSYVFQIGHSQFAIDREMAKKIFVKPR